MKRARLEKAVLERAAAAAESDKIVAAKTMHAAMLGRDDWDFESVDVERGTTEIDWRSKMEKGTLSDKQLKIAESIRSKEYKLQVIVMIFLHRVNLAFCMAVLLLQTVKVRACALKVQQCSSLCQSHHRCSMISKPC